MYSHSNNWVFHFYRKVIPIEAKVYTDRGKMLYQFEEKRITLVGKDSKETGKSLQGVGDVLARSWSFPCKEFVMFQ